MENLPCPASPFATPKKTILSSAYAAFGGMRHLQLFRFLNKNGHFKRKGLSVREIELFLFVLGPLKGKMTDCLHIVFGAYFDDGADG